MQNDQKRELDAAKTIALLFGGFAFLGLSLLPAFVFPSQGGMPSATSQIAANLWSCAIWAMLLWDLVAAIILRRMGLWMLIIVPAQLCLGFIIGAGVSCSTGGGCL